MANLNKSDKAKSLLYNIKNIVNGLTNVKIILIATFADIPEPECFSLFKSLEVRMDNKFKINNKLLFSNLELDPIRLEELWKAWEKQITLLLDYQVQL